MGTPEHWQRVKELFHAALEHGPAERASFLDEACASDEELRREVESLIASHERPGNFIDSPAYEGAAEILTGERSASLAGQTLGHYKVLSLLGAGGMGEVYHARDTRLGREVAIKVLPPAFSSDRERLLRFEREARTASSLNHPNVCTIHEIGESQDGHHYIVMEYVEGRTLRDLLKEKGMKVAEAIEVGAQMAAALTAAHAAGVIHRDIKPENLLLRHDRLVKVLDFGLAKLIEQKQQIPDSQVPTRAQVNTRTGVVMGTVAYMSPEQARGLAVDARTDVWSLGCVLYEMVAGRTPFEGATNSDVIVSILEREPMPVTRFAPEVPAELQRIISKALRKDREERYQVMKDLALDLKSLKEEVEFGVKLEHTIRPEADRETDAGKEVKSAGPAGAGAPHSFRRQRKVAALALAVLVMASGGIALWRSERGRQEQLPTDKPAPQSRIIPVTSLPGSESQAAFSPDGNQLAFVWDGTQEDNPDIYVKLVDAGEPLRLTTNPAPDLNPVWSPDGRHLAFTREGEGAGIYLVPALGGAERKLAEIFPKRPLHKGSLGYSPNGKYLAVADKDSEAEPYSIFLLAVETGEKRRLTSPPPGSRGDETPAFSPDGKSLAFARMLAIGSKEIFVVPVSGGEPKRLTFDETMTIGLTWTADGREIVFSSWRGGSVHLYLWRVPIAGGTPTRADVYAQNLRYPAISRKGDRLAWTQQFDDSNIWRIEVTPSTGHVAAPVNLIASTMRDSSPQYSPDGQQIVFGSTRSGNSEIWVCDREGINPIQLTNLGDPNTGTPRWSPDGRQIAFDAMVEGNRDIYVISANGGKARRLTAEISEEVCPSWSRDGQWIYFGSNRSGSLQIWKMPAVGGPAVQVTKQGGFEGFESPDSKYFYYAKGRHASGIWRIPVEGGEETPVLDHHRAGYWRYWAVTEQGIYFATAETSIGPMIEFFSFATGEVTPVATIERRIGIGASGLAVSPDRRWILYTQVDQSGSDIMLVENFR